MASSIISSILSVRKDSDTVQKTVLTNVIQMLHNRKWISDKNVNKLIEETTSSFNDNQLYKIPLDVKLLKLETYDPDTLKSDKFEDNLVIVKIIPQKITSIGKSPIILEFINEYDKNHKLLIVESITDKQKHTLVSNNKYLEIFDEWFFMLDLFQFVCCPKYEILTKAETDELLETNNLKLRQMKKMYDSDKASLYLYLKQKQVVKIIRNSEITGLSVDYRVVVHKN